MNVRTEWRPTQQGQALYIFAGDTFVAFPKADLASPGQDWVAWTAAITLWEGIAGLRPARGLWRRWRWRRGVQHLQRQIHQLVGAEA